MGDRSVVGWLTEQGMPMPSRKHRQPRRAGSPPGPAQDETPPSTVTPEPDETPPPAPTDATDTDRAAEEVAERDHPLD